MSAIKQFRGMYYFLSNFYKCNITYDGITYPSTEAAFQAQKTLDNDEKQKFTTMEPLDAKRAGKTVKLRPDWEHIKLNIMHDICKIKFSEPELMKKLLDTGDATLVEGNNWNDTYWGVNNNGDGYGENYLGIILMQVRDELKRENGQ